MWEKCTIANTLFKIATCDVIRILWINGTISPLFFFYVHFKPEATLAFQVIMTDGLIKKNLYYKKKKSQKTSLELKTRYSVFMRYITALLGDEDKCNK